MMSEEIESNDRAAERSAKIERFREAVRTMAENTSLRKVAREIGMSASGLKKFLEGAAPYSPTMRRLHRWYVQHAGVQHDWLEFPEADAAMRVLVHELTPGSRRATAERMVECLRRGYEESGKTPPGWLSELTPKSDDSPPDPPAES